MSLSYPVFDDAGSSFLGEYYDVASFVGWQFAPSLQCAYPPCLEPLQRPVPGLGAVNVFESAASSVYHGLTVSVRRRMTDGFYFRLAYTYGHARDDGQDALVAGRPAIVQNSYAPSQEWGRSITDQRHRLVLSWIYEPRLFDRGQPTLRAIFNNWRLSSLTTLGSGRPVNAMIVGDANQDANTYNDRFPGVSRNAFNGPDYATTDFRLTRLIPLRSRLRLEAMVEAFNVFNRTNRRVVITDDGFLNTAGNFVPIDQTVGVSHYPAYYTRSSTFLYANDVFAPRQVQLALKVIF